MKNYRDGLTAEDRFALRCMFHAKHSNASESRQALQKAMTEGFARKHKSGFHVVWKKSATPRSEHSVQNQRDLDAVLERLMGTQEASPKLRAVKKDTDKVMEGLFSQTNPRLSEVLYATLCKTSNDHPHKTQTGKPVFVIQGKNGLNT